MVIPGIWLAVPVKFLHVLSLLYPIYFHLVSYVAKLEDGTIFERKGAGEGEPLVFVTDEEQVILGLDKAVATMKRGEKAVLTISPEYGFGNVEVQRDLAKVPQCSVLIYEVEMLDFVKVLANTGTWKYWV